MPMLERTAASLEPCNFQRVLPPTKTPFKSTRRLHTSFWQHGAADIELSNIWQALIREPLESLNLLPTSQYQSGFKNDSPSASTFLLDFLYPQTATLLLRKLSPSVLDRYERPRLYLRGAVPRLFTSSASAPLKSHGLVDDAIPAISAERASETASGQVEDAAPAERHAAPAETAIEGNVIKATASVDTSSALDVITDTEDHARRDTVKVGSLTGEATVQDDIASEAQASQQKSKAKARSMAKLRTLLHKDNASDFDEIWKIFHAHEPEELRSQFTDFITKHYSMTYLLAHCLQQHNLRTLAKLWPRHPAAHREDGKAAQAPKLGASWPVAMNWNEFERCTKLDPGPAAKYKYENQDEHWGARRPVHLSNLKSDKKLMSGIAALIVQLHDSKGPTFPNWTSGLTKTLLNTIVYPIIHRYHQRLRLQDYAHLPELVKDPILYEIYLQHTAMDPMYRELSDALYKAYRKLPKVKMRTHVMRAMVHHVYKPVDNAQGMEMVLGDLYRRHPRLDMNMYRAFLRFYARRADVKSTQRIFDEYRAHFAAERRLYYSEDKQRREPDFLRLLELYTDRGELGEVRRIFTQAQADFGPELTIKCWNILLHAHAVAREYDAAIRVFYTLKQAVAADHHTYGTMMGMTGIRGDLEFTLELYRMAKSEDIAPNSHMVDCVVEAYCQNDKFKDAENIVTITTEKERFSKSDLAFLWNSLLWHHATRRDLRGLNETLQKMTEHSIAYNSETYSHLLRGLGWCRQPHHALFLMRQAVKTQSFKPTLEHFTLLMGAFLWTQQPGELLRTSTILRNLGMPQTGDLLLQVLRALRDWATAVQFEDADKARAYLVSMLRQYRESIERSRNNRDHLPLRKVKESRIEWKAEPITVRQRTEQTNSLIYTFTLMRQATDVQDIFSLWQSSSPEASSALEPPTRLLHALMHAAFYEGNYDEVREIWTTIFERAVQQSHVSGPGSAREVPLPSMRYMLTDPLKTMQRMHGVTADPDGLRATINSVLRAGFRLDSKNWNYYVQLLASLKRWREAFTVAEERLMPFWHGWAKVRARTRGVPNKIPREILEKTNHPHAPRPTAHTLLGLSKAYMDLGQMTAWSGEAERLKAYIELQCPAGVAAVKSAIRHNSPTERQILGEGKPKDRSLWTEEELEEEAKKNAVHKQQLQARRLYFRQSRQVAPASGTDIEYRGYEDEDGLPQTFGQMMEQSINQTEQSGEEAYQDGYTFAGESQPAAQGDDAATADVDFTSPPVDGNVDDNVDDVEEDGVADIWADVDGNNDEDWAPMGPGHEQSSAHADVPDSWGVQSPGLGWDLSAEDDASPDILGQPLSGFVETHIPAPPLEGREEALHKDMAPKSVAAQRDAGGPQPESAEVHDGSKLGEREDEGEE